MIRTPNTTPWWQRSFPASLTIGIFSAVVLYSLYKLIGTIPVEGGAGWDGRIYLHYIELLGRGEPISADPYRSIRMSGFVPLIGASALGASPSQLIEIQALQNIAFMAIAAALFHDVLRQLGVLPRTALLTSALTLMSWPFMVMPYFYPVLSDNIALALTCLCLWCWARAWQLALYLLLAYFVWLMPGLFLVALVLAVMPRQVTQLGSPALRRRSQLLAFGVAMLAVVPLLLSQIADVTDTELASHATHLDGQTSLMALRKLSEVSLMASLTFALWLGARAVCDPSLWQALRPRAVLPALLAFSTSALAMYYLIDWNSGFKGPPLLHFMVLQSLAAPFKPLVAHFLSFGPIIILAIASCIAWACGRSPNTPKALLACMLAFLPLLMIGSESRQWLGILPIAGALVAVSGFSTLQRVISIVFAVVLILPMFWLKAATHTAASEQLSYQSTPWQFYFGRQGPWMSVQVYETGVLLLGLYILLMIGAYLYDKHRKTSL
ncbi:hypothetical protein [Pseudomonas donghuensis]|uniref:hypothetical protein n=1 Tax=Pseudomonas donghuensis TaxID=1163398 RepID=UPI00029A14D0|nr:hypothetical protein [Pseudomonas donghuensis]